MLPPKRQYELSGHLVSPADKDTSHPVASRQVKASMSPSCHSCSFLLNEGASDTTLFPRPLASKCCCCSLLLGCEHFRSCLRMLVDCEARLCVRLMQSLRDLLQSWVTLGWEYGHSETDPGHWLARRRNDSPLAVPLWHCHGDVTP